MEDLTLAPHTAVTISVAFRHQWSYDGELSTEVPGGTSFQLIMRGAVSMQTGSQINQYELRTWHDGSGSAADVVALRYENQSAMAVSYPLNARADLVMVADNLYTPVAAAVPEPGAIAMLLCGAPLVAFALRRRRPVHLA
jgi:hypothetical protein